VGVTAEPASGTSFEDLSARDDSGLVGNFDDLWPVFDQGGSGSLSKAVAAQMYKYVREASLWENELLARRGKLALTCQEDSFLTQSLRDVCESCSERFTNSYTCNSEEALSCLNNLSLMGGECQCLDGQYLLNNYCHSCEEQFPGSATCTAD